MACSGTPGFAQGAAWSAEIWPPLAKLVSMPAALCRSSTRTSCPAWDRYHALAVPMTPAPRTTTFMQGFYSQGYSQRPDLREEEDMPAQTKDLLRVKVAPKGMGLNDFVAYEEGYYADEGLDLALDWKTFRGTQSSWKEYKYMERPQDQAAQGGEQVYQCACLWGTISNASAGMGKVVPDCYGVSPWSIFVRPESKIRKPGDLKDVPISVGMRAGSHFNVPWRLEKFLPLENIKVVNTGGFGARLKGLLQGRGGAGRLLPPPIA